jgi:hypothetical protein
LSGRHSPGEGVMPLTVAEAAGLIIQVAGAIVGLLTLVVTLIVAISKKE